MLEHSPSQTQRIEISGLNGKDGLLVFDSEFGLLGLENAEPTQLHPLESELFKLLANSPNHPFRLADIRDELLSFEEKYAPMPLDVVKGLVDTAPILEGHILAVVNGNTQFFSFLDKARDSNLFIENLDAMMQNTFLSPSTERSRHERTMKVVRYTLGAAASVSAIVGYKHFKRRTNNVN
jgi:hypothetical protein